jgi:putative Mn2+ efflux pump MntP
MRVFQAVLVFIGLALDSFVLMMNQGARLPKLKIRDAVQYAGVYAATSVGAVLLGYALSFILKNMMGDRAEVFVACIAIFTIGCYIMIKSWRLQAVVERIDKDFCLKRCFHLAAATSLDTLFLGVCFSFLGITLFWAVLLSAIVTFLSILVAVIIGYNIGSGYTRVVGMSGGSLMVIFSLYLLAVYVVRM